MSSVQQTLLSMKMEYVYVQMDSITKMDNANKYHHAHQDQHGIQPDYHVSVIHQVKI